MLSRVAQRRSPRRWAGPAVAVGVLAALLIAGLSLTASAATIPAGFFTVTDQQGANDVPAQSDLTMMGRLDTASVYKLFWSWDSIDQWTGTGQTGDACALFDKNGNGLIDSVACGQVANKNADPTIVVETVASPFFFSCSDKKPDRCTNPSPVSFTSSQLVAGVLGTPTDRTSNLVTDLDPFLTGSNYNKDATIEIDVQKASAGGILPAGSTLVNVCSYPSAGNGGNNNPFDCIVTPGGGFLTITKNAGSDTTTSFPFTVSPTPVAPQPSTYTIIGSGSTPAIGIDITSSASATESVPAGWTLTGAQCKLSDGTTTTGAFSAANHNVTGVQIQSGLVTTCTFTDTPIQPTLTITKTVVNDNGGTKHATDFGFAVDGGTATAFTQDGTDVLKGKNVMTLSAAAHTLSEPAVAGYAASVWGGDCAANGAITLANGENKTCTITNDDQAATLIVKKVVVNDNGGTKIATNFSFQVNGGTVTSFLQDNDTLHGKNTLTVSAGTFSVTEPAVTGYGTTYDNCSNVVIANGGTATCTITNNDVAATLIVKKVVINDNGGTKHATDFSFQLGNATAVTFLQDGTDVLAGKNTLTVDAGTYSVTEPAVTGYGTTYDNCSNVVIANGGTATCTITNDDTKASPGISTGMSWTLNDSVTLTGFRTGGTGGTATFSLFKGDATCSDITKRVFQEASVSVDNTTGSASTTTGYTASDPAAAGTYYWMVSYSGNNYNAANNGSSTCGDEVTTLP
jgi:hypothetical protein